MTIGPFHQSQQMEQGAAPTACSSFFKRLLSDMQKSPFLFGAIDSEPIVFSAAPPLHAPPKCLFSLVGYPLDG